MPHAEPVDSPEGIVNASEVPHNDVDRRQSGGGPAAFDEEDRR